MKQIEDIEFQRAKLKRLENMWRDKPDWERDRIGKALDRTAKRIKRIEKALSNIGEKA